MVSFFALATLAVIPAALAQQLMINTPPSVVQCQPVQLSWTGGTPPYFLSFLPAGQPSAPAIKQFPNQNGNSFTWKADLASGSTFTISLKDSTGAPAFSDKVTVQSGPDSSCINTAITEDGTGGTAAPTAGGASSGASSGSTPAATTTGGAAASSGGSSSGGPPKPTSTSGGSPSSSSASPSNAASNTKGNALAMAGVMGLVGAVLF